MRSGSVEFLRVEPRAARGVRFGASALAIMLALSLVPGRALAQTPNLPLPSTTNDSLASAKKGDVNATAKDGYGRMVFAFQEAVGAEVRISGGVLVVLFRQPVLVNVDRLVQELPGYITAVRADPDGRGLRMALGRQLTVNTMEAGERIFVDLLPDSWKAPPPSLPLEVVEDLARRAREAERKLRLLEVQKTPRAFPPVTVRIGNHPTFTRLVFGLPEPVGVSLDRSGERLTVKVGKAFPTDLKQVKGALPVHITSIESDTSDEALTFKLVVAANADVRGFREDGTYVVDIALRDQVQPAQEAPLIRSQAPAMPRDAREAVNLPSETAPVAPALPAGARSAAKPLPPMPPAPSQMPVQTPAPVAAPVNGPASAPPAPAPRAMAPVETAPQAVATPVISPSRVEKSAEAVPPVAQASGNDGDGLLPPPSGGRPVAVPSFGEAAPAQQKMVAQVHRVGDTLRILLPFAQETPGAIFQRGDTLWMVFDSKTPLDLAGLQAEPSGAFRSVDAARSGGGVAIRVGLDKAVMSSANRDGTAWIITLGQTRLEPPRPVQLQRGGTEEQPAMFAEFDKPGAVHRINDPLVGDDIIAVTGEGPPRSILRQQDFVDFQALSGSHGLAFVPLTDDLRVSIDGNRVQITRPSGLALSSVSTMAQAAPARGLRRSRATSFDVQMWGYDRDAGFANREADLIRVAANAPDPQRTAARLDLVRFYLAKDLFVEAKAVIDTVLNTDRRTAEDGSLMGLRGLVNVMMRRPKDAISDLSHPAVIATQDATLWRAMALVQQARYKQAHEGFKTSQALIASLPESMQRRALFAAIEAAVEVGDLAFAAARLAELEHIGVPAQDEPQLLLVSGRVAEAEGRLDDATIRYNGAGNGAHGPAKAEADLRLILMKHRMGKLNRDAAVEALEKHHFTWRGDEIEARSISALGRLYADGDNYRPAFTLMRTALKVFPESEATRALQERMHTVFEQLFLEGKADGMNPIDALAMFYDYRDMTPQGRKGDEMIRRLADRLVSIDLLDQAAQLLKHQVDNRLVGAARAQVAARLAVIHLMNRKPGDAISTLRATRLAELPEQLRVQRYLLEAKALSEVGRHEQALELLSDVRSREADSLRVDILWSAERQHDAADYAEKIVSARGQADKPLDDEERRLILRSAIGYALTDDTLGLHRLRAKFKPLMDGSLDARSFDITTAPIESRGVEYREMAKSLADRDTLESFIKAYRERYPADMPGALAPNADAAKGPARS